MTRDEITTALVMIVIHAKKYAATENDGFREEYLSLIDKDQRAILAEFDALTADLAEAQENVQAFGKIIIAEVVEKRE